MTQSSFIAAALLAGFILYLAAKNRLIAYTAVLWGANNAPAPTLANTGASPAKIGVSTALFGASGPTTATMNPVQGLGSVISTGIGLLTGLGE